MTDELKTLKDIEVWDLGDHGFLPEDPEYNAVQIKDLKAEAVKWVKHFHLIGQTNPQMAAQTYLFIIEFFNLTEDDLK